MNNLNNFPQFSINNKLYLKELFTLIRLKHYIKNILVFIPLIFSLNFIKGQLFLDEVLSFISISFAASFIYIINDIIDKEKDRKHPIKRNRPIASGTIKVMHAYVIGFTLVTVSLFIAFLLNFKCLLIVLLYIIVNFFYSIKLKNIVIIDVSIIALGFMLRVIIGGISIGVSLSQWLLLTIMTVSFYLGFGKRRNEISKISKEQETRKVLEDYNIKFLDKAMNSMMTLSIAFYALWSIDSQVVKVFNSDKLILTVPVVMLGMFRYSLIIEGDSYGDPTDIILCDKLLQLIIIIYLIIIFVLIYKM